MLIWSPEERMAIEALKPLKYPYITLWETYPNLRRPTDFSEEAK